MVATSPVLTTVIGEPPSIVYVNVYGAVPFEPVKVTSGAVPFLHTAVVPLISADGVGLTVIVVTSVLEHALPSPYVYVNICVPADGSNTNPSFTLPVTPVPVQVPPTGEPISVTGLA